MYKYVHTCRHHKQHTPKAVVFFAACRLTRFGFPDSNKIPLNKNPKFHKGLCHSLIAADLLAEGVR